jgi:uncharacterized protein (DUF362 family)
MSDPEISRRIFLKKAAFASLGTAALGSVSFLHADDPVIMKKHIVSIARVKNGHTGKAVEEAIDLLGGIRDVTRGQDSIMLKPNLVTELTECTTKVNVIEALARLMKKAGKEVIIGEGSAAAYHYNVIGDQTCRTRNREILDGMQQHVFDSLGYSELAKSLKIPLVNLHSGDLIDVALGNGYVAESVKIHKSVANASLVCSVPMMKTHVLATVTLAMKNLLGLYPGTAYYSVRSWLHDKAWQAGSQGVAYEIMDINQAVTTGLSVIDASSAMEGDGPTGGHLVDMNLIIAGTSPLATDIVGATVMGFDYHEIPFIELSNRSGMLPASLDDIEIRGMKIEEARHPFAPPHIYKWSEISQSWGVREI